MPSITQLQYIVAVDSHRHFGRAAKDCHVSQPSLSAQIQKVEEELSFVIFDRSKNPILTTAQGERLIKQAKIVLKEHKRIFEIETDGSEPSGSFQLGVIPTLIPYVVPMFIESFSRKYPKVNLSISELKTEDIISSLYEDEIDGAILVTPLYDDKIIELSLFFEPFYAFVAKDHPLYRKKRVKDGELNPDSIWLLDEGHCFRDQVIRVCSMRKEKKIMKNINFRSGSLETLMNMVRKGHGYTLIPHLATLDLSEQEKQKNLKSFVKPVPTREVSLVHSRSFLKEKIIEALESEVILNLPPEIQSLKKGNISVIDI
jgi:LysR family hydrogen peroxide-inducible transcriptional activator